MRVELFKGKKGYYLRLVAKNGEVLATSESYTTRWGARRAAKKNFARIPIKEVDA